MVVAVAVAAVVVAAVVVVVVSGAIDVGAAVTVEAVVEELISLTSSPTCAAICTGVAKFSPALHSFTSHVAFVGSL